MPLPTNNTAWPPAEWAPAYASWRENDAWLTGNTDELKALYGQEHEKNRPTHRLRGQDRTGGLVGAAVNLGQRMFWGRPVPDGENRTRLHIPAASDISVLSSDLLFAEPPKITLGESEKNEKAQTRLELIASSDQAHATYNQLGELSSGLGAAALVTTWDVETADNVWNREVGADCTVPEFRNGKLIALTVWSEYIDGAVYWRHLERHESGAIIHGLYQGSREKLGGMVDVREHPATAHYADMKGTRLDGRAIVVPTGTTRLTASWMLNLPAREWRKKGILADAGRSDYGGGVKALFDALDETWSSWMRDIDLGRARLVVPSQYLESSGFGGGTSFDTDRAVYSPINVPGQMTVPTIEQVQFAIRVDEHERTANALYERILVSAGFRDPDQGGDRATPETATGTIDGTKAKERNRDKKSLYAKAALAHSSSVALEIDGLVFGNKGGGRFDDIDVEFVAVSQEDPEKKSRTIASLRAATVMSIETGVKMAQPDLDDKAAGEEVARIMAETGRKVPDPSKLERVDATSAQLAEAAARMTPKE